MPKYMKDPKLKPPRDKRVELEDKQYTIAELKEAIHKSRQEQDLSTSTLWNRNELIIEVEE